MREDDGMTADYLESSVLSPEFMDFWWQGLVGWKSCDSLVLQQLAGRVETKPNLEFMGGLRLGLDGAGEMGRVGRHYI